MSIQLRRSGLALLVLFVLSGFAGLVYQSVWSHYLGLTLGHAAYAQSLVLAIFMGGMALGAWLASRQGARWRHLILAYAVIEGVIGVCGLVFHPFFLAYSDFSQQTMLPMLGSAGAASAWQWLSAALIIAPQCVLLGATFPLLSAGLLRMSPGEDGQVLGGLYFTNSVGASVGALATAFVLLPKVGMPGAVMTAGLLNILVGLAAWAIWRMTPADGASTAVAAAAERTPARVPEPAPTADQQSHLPPARQLAVILLVTTFLSGAFSFVYEIGWVRMLNQALGTTIHSFELMLSAFILGLAVGGLWIRRRARSPGIVDAVAYAGRAQVYMGVAALVSVPVFTQSFEWVGWLMRVLSRTDEAYTLFSIGSGAIALLVMFPAAFFAGMTLPLFTMALLRRGAGEAVIGRVYAANTLGAIAGVMIAVHVLIPLLGVRLAVTLAALGDVLLGIYLLRMVSPGRPEPRVIALAALGVFAFVASMHLGRVDPRLQTSGVFRTGIVELDPDMQVLYLRDGKTATVSVSQRAGGSMSIATNGKPDAAMATSLDVPPSSGDEVTMLMLGASPLVFHPRPERVAFIGWGSGLSTHTVLGSPLPREVETVEIERAMYDGARLFGERVSRAYEDPRSRVHFDDARTYFSTGARTYDVIVSEPSNPWVSGVASLFTVEFYRFLGRHLADDGVLVQWLHAYEIDDRLVAIMVAALLEVFPDTEVYLTNAADFVFIARKGGERFEDVSRLAEEPLASEMRRVGLISAEDFGVRRIGGPEVLRTFVRLQGVSAHSDFFPVVSLDAPRTRFLRREASQLTALLASGLPLRDALEGYLPPRRDDPVSVSDDSVAALIHQHAGGVARALKAPSAANRQPLSPVMNFYVEALRSLSAGPVSDDDLQLWSEALANVVDETLGALHPDDHVGVLVAPAWIDRSVQGEWVVGVLDALEASARRDHQAAGAIALWVLEQDAPLAGYLREQMLVIAQLGAVASRHPGGVRELEERFGQTVPGSTRLIPVRQFLLAWEDAR